MGSSHQQERRAITYSSIKAGSSVQRNGESPLSDEAIRKRLRDAGFDEESIKRRDKAALIAYVAKLESEIFDYQHHMGLLILERKDWTSKYEQVKASADLAEITYKRDQAAHSSALAEVRKREESLRKALGIKKECIANIEKTLHEMRAESAETKIAAESKMAEALNMLENAQKKFVNAEAKLHSAESLQAEASRYNNAAERKLLEVEAREDELRRHLISFKSECDAKVKEMNLERQSLCERQKILQQGQERLLDGQALLNQREEYIFGRYQELSKLEKELEASKAKIEKEFGALNVEKSDLDKTLAALSTREEAVIKREVLLEKKEQELLIVKEKLASKEYDEIQRLMAEHEAALEMRKSEFEAELEQKRKLMEDAMENKRRACELREVDLSCKEELILEREHDLELQSTLLEEKEKDATLRLKLLEEKEQNLNAAEKAAELEKMHLQKEKEDINKMKLDLQNSMESLENRRKQVDEEQKKLETSENERNELLVLEMKLKEEIYSIRAQKLELIIEADELKAEKSKFEIEWELIDEKREELRKEAECVAEERNAVSKFFKDERDNLKLEKVELRDQFKHDVVSLSLERESFVSKMEQEHSEWFSKIQEERAAFVLDIEMQKRESENCIDKRREEIESYLREKEGAFEQEKTKELQYISSLKETVAKEREQIVLEMKRLDNERMEIVLDREQREKEWAEVKKTIEELQIQSEKLKKQRELLHAEREEIYVQTQYLNKLENLKIASDDIALSEIQQADQKSRWKFPPQKCLNLQTTAQDVELDSHASKEAASNGFGVGLHSKQAPDSASPVGSPPFSWIKRCAEIIFKHSPQKLPIKHGERSLISEFEGAKLLEDKYYQNDKEVVYNQLENVQDTSSIFEQQRSKGMDSTDKILRTRPVSAVIEEPRVILEVPSVGENVKSADNLESKTKPDDTKNSVQSYPEQRLRAGRKRLNNSSPRDNVDATLEHRRNNKKRRQRKDTTKTPIVVSTQAISPEDENGLKSFNQIPGDTEQTCDVMDKNKTPDGTTENKGIDASVEQATLDCSQNSTSTLDQDNIQSRGSDRHADSPSVGNGITSCCSKEQRKVEGVLLEAHEEPPREYNQCQGEVIAETTIYNLNNQGESSPENNIKADEKDE